MTWQLWLKGLLAAVIGGAANSVTAVFIAPDKFNFSHDGLIALAKLAGAGALLALFMYLKQSPVPSGWDGVDRRGEGTAVKIAGTGAGLLLLLCLSLTAACHKQIVAPHPGALDAFDSQTYDALNVAQSVLDQAKIEYTQGNLPAGSKLIINRTGYLYNVARDAWLEYRAVKQAGEGKPQLDAIAAKVTAAVRELNNTIVDLRKLIGGGK